MLSPGEFPGRHRGPRWFDGHLDLAYLAVCGRDMHAQPEDAGGLLRPAAVTLPSLKEGGIAACLATIFTEGVDGSGGGVHAYPLGDAEAAHAAAVRQLAVYHAWREAGDVSLVPARVSGFLESSPDGLAAGILMECADPIREPGEAAWWASQGVVAVGMAWWNQGRYAGGNGVQTGLTDIGRDLVVELDRLGIIHDLSHLSQAATDELLALSDAPVIASHSNCRALLGGCDNTAWQRHLADATIVEIARRGGVIGINLVRNFVQYPLGRDDRPPVEGVADHIEHVARLVGHARAVGLGSDMDGGITADDLPAGIERPADLQRIADALASRGWRDDDIHAFAWGNWARFWNVGSLAAQ